VGREFNCVCELNLGVDSWRLPKRVIDIRECLQRYFFLFVIRFEEARPRQAKR